ncbi:Deoxyribodipyrimidine photo-lyase [Venturia nashicola]|uniref:Deoxyribodipyrimidine photo-lyase n=1 Tax=Venturia nashicola TaxID=86259 RepID=A0A4Z1NYD6_9PEZI|nr:Deoxyribodipyrimidine photo-lyase [Venturia nashicola]
MATKRKAGAVAANAYSDSTGSKANTRSELASSPTKKAKSSQTTLDGGIATPKQSIRKIKDEPSKERIDTPVNGTTSQNNPPSKISTKKPKAEHADEVAPIQRQFYPPEMTNERCAQYNSNEIPRPIEVMNKAITETKSAREKIQPGKAVLHWFKRDLRISDNKALAMASNRAKATGASLICVFVVSPQDYEAHLTSAVRVDFELRSLEIMKRDLEELGIPLLVTIVEKRKSVPDFLIGFCEKWDVKHVFCNIEYEVDELRREAKMTRACLEKGINFTAINDDVVVTPGDLKTGTGKQYAVYSPWYRSWMAHIHSHPHILDESPKPSPNPSTSHKLFQEIFDTPVPSAPPNKSLTAEEKTKFKKLWPASEHAAHSRLQKFISTRIKPYKDTRNFPAQDGTSVISVHLSTGTLSARTCIRLALAANSTSKLDTGNEGIKTWISEVAWRDFYKHVMVHWPYVCMSKPFKYEYANVEWDHDDDLFRKWCEGRTGFPIVDAAMRQMNEMGWMHNRLRMIVASFLAKDLLLDWRLGERYFMERLIDGDFASNNGGWGFSASVGVDPQPYFRIFNPLLQSEKFDPEGVFIRKWVPELKEVVGKAVHEPFGRKEGLGVKKAGYPEPCVVHKEAREKALKRYKEASGRGTA